MKGAQSPIKTPETMQVMMLFLDAERLALGRLP